MTYRRNCKIIVVIFCCLLVNILGCASFKETAKGVAGVSTKVLEEGRADAIKRSFPYDFNTCHDKAIEFLNKRGSYIYARDEAKKMLAFYFSQEDTSPVGLFFDAIDEKITQIEVASPSTYAKESIAEILFKALEKETEIEKENVGNQ